ncbi:MAG: CPBP family intramembrane metalloprotease [Ruminococcus flavefaciens]|nr:CPBP family intramembrane metalloprotease [Ruminococcus flavefaciens]MCM1228720.1 CPBP family intramembrane metalloprotease [Ruminococcus flavefaciens]
MEEYIGEDRYRAEISGLNREICSLTERLNQQEYVDKFNPFDNPTEYRGFSGNYARIVPALETQNVQLPLEPDYQERRNLRRFYSIGGWCMIFQFVMTTFGAILLMTVIRMCLQFINPEISPFTLYEYMRGSSIIASLNMLVYLVCNVLNAFIGMKWSGIKPVSIISTRNFSFGNAVQYCMTALFLWVVAIYASTAINDILAKYGYDSYVDNSGVGQTALGTVIMTLYTCVIAPITEELFFRGMLLKVFSRANQRFAIFATAIFFGLAHGNIPQFLLAFLLGILLAHITMKHSSIIPAVIVHIFVNTFSTVFSYIGDAGIEVQQVAMLLLFAAAILGMIMLLVFYGENKLPLATPRQSRRGLDVALGSVPLCIAFVVQAIYMVYVLVSNS